MRMRTMLAVVLLVGGAMMACAQSEVVSVTDWRVHAGDDLSWARPGLDDSGWLQTSFPAMVFSDTGADGWHWYRASFSIPADLRGRQISLGMAALDDVYDVYVEGVPIAHFGSFTPAPHGTYPRHIAFPIPMGLLHGTVGHVAVRRWRSTWTVRLLDFGAAGTVVFPHPPQIGPADVIVAREQRDLAWGAIQQMPANLTCILFLFAAAISVVLFSVQNRRKEYFYLALFCLVRGVPHLAGDFTATSQSIDSRSWGPVLIFTITSSANVFSNLFLAALCPRFRRILVAGAVVSGVIAVLLGVGMAVDAGYQFPVLYMMSVVPLAFQMVAVWGLLRDREKGSLIIGVSLFMSSGIVLWGSNNVFLHKHPDLSLGPFLIDYRDAAGVAFIFVVLAVLYLRYWDEQVRQAAAEQNLAAARRMQEQLLGTGAGETPGFAVEVAYRPAQEVGGDFYRTVALRDGSLLVVIGDVSGKGLDAAMLVAAILGSLANEVERSPALLLEYLNHAVTGRTGGGFITVCCARFFSDGRVAIANAGHVFPYLPGREVKMGSGLPLGIIPHASYCETEIETQETIVFLTDGVVEARNANGELLGFDQMAALTTKAASEIADVAQRWGQEDDITVLSVIRTGALKPGLA
jgi:sigma-B regulation protein RsbU (phosphoserine phosphatase)